MGLALNSGNWKSFGKGLLVVMGGAGLTYAAESIPNIDLGELTPVVMMGLTALISYLRRVFDEYKKNSETNQPLPANISTGVENPMMAMYNKPEVKPDYDDL